MYEFALYHSNIGPIKTSWNIESVLPLCSENIFDVRGDAGFVCPVKGDPIEDWDARGDLGAEWCCPCLGFRPFIFETGLGWAGVWPIPSLALGKGGGGGGREDPWYPTGGWPGILPCWAPIPSGDHSFT